MAEEAAASNVCAEMIAELCPSLKDDPRVVLGPVVKDPDPSEPPWYFAIGGADRKAATFSKLSGYKREQVEGLKSTLTLALIQAHPIVLIDTDDELRMATTIWPSPRTRKLVAAITDERAQP